MPSRAIRSRLGVVYPFAPKLPMSAYPMSSTKKMTKLGGLCARVANRGVSLAPALRRSIVRMIVMFLRILENESKTALNLPIWSRRVSNRPSLRRAYDSIGPAKMRGIREVVEFSPELKPHRFGDGKIPAHKKIKVDHSRSLNHIPAGISVSKSCRRGERQRIKP